MCVVGRLPGFRIAFQWSTFTCCGRLDKEIARIDQSTRIVSHSAHRAHIIIIIVVGVVVDVSFSVAHQMPAGHIHA